MNAPVNVVRIVRRPLASAAVVCFAGGLAACSNTPSPQQAEAITASADRDSASAGPPPRIRAWMDRLDVQHAYDPTTGFIVAREVIELPEVIAAGPSLADAVKAGQHQSLDVVVFATADRCAPCQQYKKSALNDPAVIEALNVPTLIVTHIEVDREAEAADALLGSRAIPMTYLIRDGERVDTLPGQRSAEELLAWLEASSADSGGR